MCAINKREVGGDREMMVYSTGRGSQSSLALPVVVIGGDYFLCICRAPGFWFLPTEIRAEQITVLTSKLLLPIARDLAALGLNGLLAVTAGACALPGAESTVSFVGYTHAPLPLPTV